ncbi:hypothetical protein RF644_17580 [Kocuria sp. CPCC 205258]
MIVALWVVVFTGLVLSPFRRTPLLFAATMGVWLASIILTAISHPTTLDVDITPWGMDPAIAMLISLFAVPMAGRLTGTLAHRALAGTYLDAWNPDGTDGFDALAEQALARRDDLLHRS